MYVTLYLHTANVFMKEDPFFIIQSCFCDEWFMPYIQRSSAEVC